LLARESARFGFARARKRALRRGVVVQGERVNNLRIVRLLREGARAAVYEAEQLASRRQVAVKVFKHAPAREASTVQSALDELGAVGAVRHPNIVEVCDLGYLPDGAPFLVMELLEGETLSARFARVGRLPWAQALDVAQQIAQALEVAHESGIIHRALMPQNVFLARDPHLPEREVVKVLGLGVAKLCGEPVVALASAGAPSGALAYMAPEQCRGASDLLDRRADIYALGAVLYQALSGQPPFLAETAGDMMLQHMNASPPRLPADLAGLPAQVERALQQALAKDPRARFASMAAFSAAFGRPLARISFPAPESPPALAHSGLPAPVSAEGVSILPSPLLPPGVARVPTVPPGRALGAGALRPSARRALWLGLGLAALLFTALIAGERMRTAPASTPAAKRATPPNAARPLAARPGAPHGPARAAGDAGAAPLLP
jgi:serine/threonine-protein kinase